MIRDLLISIAPTVPHLPPPGYAGAAFHLAVAPYPDHRTVPATCFDIIPVPQVDGIGVYGDFARRAQGLQFKSHRSLVLNLAEGSCLAADFDGQCAKRSSGVVIEHNLCRVGTPPDQDQNQTEQNQCRQRPQNAAVFPQCGSII